MSDEYEITQAGQDGILAKKDKLAFFALNLLLAAPYILQHFTLIGCGLAGAIFVVIFIFTVLRPGVDVPAIRNLPLMLFLDAFVPLVLDYNTLIIFFDLDNLEYALSGMDNLAYLVLLALGVGLRFIKFKDPLRVWMKCLSKTCIGAAIFLILFGNGSLFPPMYNPTGVAFFLYLLCAAAWCVLCVLSYRVDSESFVLNNWLSRGLLALLAVLCLTETRYVYDLFPLLAGWLNSISEVSLAWWRTALTVVLLVGGAIAAYDYDRSRMGVDSLFLGALAGGLLLLRVLMDFSFPFCLVLLLVYLAGSACCFRNELKQWKTLRLASPIYLIAQTGAALLSVLLLYCGLWMPLLLLALYGAVFYAAFGKMTTPMRRLVWWLTLLSLPPALSAAFLWQAYAMAEPLPFLAAAYAVFAFAIVILNWPQPDKQRTSPNVYKWTICGFMTALSLLVILL